MPMNLLLKCHDVDTTLSFYRDILEFDVRKGADNTCTVEKEGGSIVFTAEDLWGGVPKCTGTMYFFIDDVEGYYQRIRDNAVIHWPLQDMPYGTREFGVQDCDEYLLAFARRV